MAKKKDDIIKKLIQNLDPESPSTNFTDKVMGKVNTAIENEVLLDKAMKSVLQRNALEKPSIDFTKNVMAQLEPSTSTEPYKPVISKKAWFFIAAATVFLLSTLNFSESQSESILNVSKYLDVFSNSLSSTLNKTPELSLPSLPQIPQILSLCIIGLSLLLLLDFSLRNKKII